MKTQDELYESIHNIISSWTKQELDDNGEATYTFNDDDREAIYNELLALFNYKLLKSE